MQFEDRLVVRGFAGCGNAATLVDGFICLTRSSLTTTGARPPATSTAPMTRSASITVRSIDPWFDASVEMRPLWIWST